MSANESKPRFEPPPWEQEAFEQFRRKKEESRKWNDFELQGTTEKGEQLVRDLAEINSSKKTHERIIIKQDSGKVEGKTKRHGEEAAGLESSEKTAGLTDSQLEAMIMQLRREEPEIQLRSMTAVNSGTVFLGLIGLAIIIEAIVLFTKVGNNDTSTIFVMATIAFVMTATGGGLIASAVMLFRKYHR